jgi:hypothetical protein
MVVALLWGLAFCETARGDYWRQTASLLPGTYMVVYIDIPGTKEIGDYRYDLSNPIGVVIGMIFKVTPPTPSGLANFLNVYPETMDIQSPTLFKSDDGGWHQVDLPCRWTLGEKAL